VRVSRRTAASLLAVGACVAAAGCGGGGKSLSKAEYASKLDRVCLVSTDQFHELHLDLTVGDWKARGADVVKIDEDFLKKFDALKPPDELKDAAAEYRSSQQKVLDDAKAAYQAAKDGNGTKLRAAIDQSNKDNGLGRAPARELGTPGC
jgi:hypothetical protein